VTFRVEFFGIMGGSPKFEKERRRGELAAPQDPRVMSRGGLRVKG
jgi:hypothetical protein